MHDDTAQLKFSHAIADITAVNKKIVKPEHFTTSSGCGKGLFQYLGNGEQPAFSLHDIWKKAQARCRPDSWRSRVV
ncbi:hypothetical protein K788_0001613 (plasmid) [Paraburkholderia caribensis MBA4]|uniref:Uncharacterized protein n=1 Tax=Paraburkholderia caribensis MBA4 TaxID=1323664 RepID=A0A0P0RM75_9BURK|nr:hypothetical protein K788_0001613 [Paraburkholderia caribensis MBA4]